MCRLISSEKKGERKRRTWDKLPVSSWPSKGGKKGPTDEKKKKRKKKGGRRWGRGRWLYRIPSCGKKKKTEEALRRGGGKETCELKKAPFLTMIYRNVRQKEGGEKEKEGKKIPRASRNCLGGKGKGRKKEKTQQKGSNNVGPRIKKGRKKKGGTYFTAFM